MHPMKARKGELPILLIYFNFRGIGQMIRYLLTYLQLPFLDILLDQYDQQKLTLPPEVLAALRVKPVNRNDLPAILHNHQIVYDLNQIMNYVCITFGREELLGVDLYQKARVCEVQERFTHRVTHNIKFLSNFVGEVQRSLLPDEQLLHFIEKRLKEFFEVSGYSKELSDLLITQGASSFVLGPFTIIDFYYVQHCRFVVKLFGNIDQQLVDGYWGLKAIKFRQGKHAKGEVVQNVRNLRAMKRYIELISSQQFYIEHQGYFDSFNFYPKTISETQIKGMKRLDANYFLDLYYDNKK